MGISAVVNKGKQMPKSAALCACLPSLTAAAIARQERNKITAGKISPPIQKAQAKFLDLQWDAQSESGKLVQLLKARPVDENAVLAQVDQVLNREREIKKAQISLLVRIKNLLTEAQQNKLMDLRRTP